MWPNRRNRPPRLQNVQEDDEEAFYYPASGPVGLLLFESLDTYAAVQRGTTRGPPCDCTEDLPLENFLTPESPYSNNMVYYQRPRQRSSTPVGGSVTTPRNIERTMDVDLNLSQNGSNNENRGSIRTRDTLSDNELSPILHPKPKKRKRNLIRVKLFDIPEPPVARQHISAHQKLPPPSTTSRLIANRIIKYARCIKNMHEKDMWCLSCGSLPTNPVTGHCGHTRCSKCIKEENKCPCGNNFPDTINSNILIRDLVGNFTYNRPSRIPEYSSEMSRVSDAELESSSILNVSVDEDQLHSAGEASASSGGRLVLKRRARGSACKQPIPMSPRARYNRAIELLQVGRHLDAAPYLALVAASDHIDCRQARKLLTETLALLTLKRDAKRLTVELHRSIRRLSSTSWLKRADMECILCCNIFYHPVTTPCGHMYCRTCLERTLDYRRRCPLCLQSLSQFNLSEASNTTFVEGALKSINAIVTPLPLDADLIPIITCTVGFPSVPCPLFIFDPRYWLMIRRVLESGTRKFGIVACETGKEYVDYGTILEVRDCVHLKDGRSILSTIGLSRFKVIERCVRDGCEVARILPIVDEIPGEMEVWDIKELGRQIILKALVWLSHLNDSVLNDIEVAFGSLPLDEESEGEWWHSSDGPAWLWWIIAVLPLRTQIKVLILSTHSLLKRMRAVSCTLETVNQHAPARATTSIRSLINM